MTRLRLGDFGARSARQASKKPFWTALLVPTSVQRRKRLQQRSSAKREELRRASAAFGEPRDREIKAVPRRPRWSAAHA